ncbi:MAG: transferase [Verrucomicrobia bacterium]|nr:MAG: transferase [Verrucomicrobiota bacterium]PYL97917.1 MAG: transferase [Verrucomicrobiota bacterium]
MKILQLVHTLDPSVGGVAAAVLALSRGLARRGHKLDVVVLDEPDVVAAVADRGPADNITVHALGSGLTSYRYSRTLWPWLRQHGGDYDRVIVNGIWQYLSFAAWRRYAGSSVPYYVFPHGMLDPWFKETFPLKHLKKWLYWPWAEYRVLRDAAAVIFTAEEERFQARKSFWLYRCREKVSPLGVEAPLISSNAKSEFLSRYPQLQNSRNFLFLGRLHPKKGCDILLEAFARFRSNDSISLILAGPDQVGWESDLRRQVTRLNLTNRVVFTGMLEGSMKQGAFASAEAFVLPSHQENFGISVVEALAVSVPVLISNRVNIWREIEADRAGYVESDDLAGTTRLVQRWIDTAPAEREMNRQNARRCFEQRFEINRAVDSLLQILNETLTAQ